MSTKSCGVLARNSVNTPAKRGSCVGLGDQLRRCSFAACGRSTKPRCSVWNLKAAGVAQAADGRRPEDADHGPFDFAVGSACWNFSAIASSYSSLLRALVERLQDDEHRAEVGAVGVQQERLAGDADGVRDAGRLRSGDLSILAITASRPLHRGRVGQLHVDQQVALILLGNEARRRAGHAPARSGPAGRRRRPPRSRSGAAACRYARP